MDMAEAINILWFFLQPENIGPDILGVPLEIAQRRKGLIFKGIHVQ